MRSAPVLLLSFLISACGDGDRSVPDPTRLIIDSEGIGTLRLAGERFGDAFGRSLGWVGDVNGDGHDDLLVGAPFAAGGGTDRGAVYLYYGGPAMDNTHEAVIVGAKDEDQFGISVADAGDLNGDGFGDFWVGAPDQADDASTHSNAVYLFHGGPALKGSLTTAVSAFRLSRGSDGSGFGISMAGNLDLDGDGNLDLLVGASHADNPSGVDSGSVYAFFGPFTTGITPREVAILGSEPNGLFGLSVSALGDLDGDGLTDFAAGAPTTVSLLPSGFPTGQGCLREGKAYLFFGSVLSGGPLTDDDAGRTMKGEALGDCFGMVVGGGRDRDGDGRPDLVVGAPSTAKGSVYVFGGATILSGSKAVSLVPDHRMDGISTTDFFGGALSMALDWNGDGLFDLAVGSFGRDSVGAVDLFNGGLTFPATPARTFAGGVINGLFGLSVTSGGAGGKGLLVGSPSAGAGEVLVIIFP